jgi:hypothetical protein
MSVFHVPLVPDTLRVGHQDVGNPNICKVAPRMITVLRTLFGPNGIAAAILWFILAWNPPSPAPGAAIGGTSPDDPFNVAMRQSAELNAEAAGLTGLSVLLGPLEEFGAVIGLI